MRPEELLKWPGWDTYAKGYILQHKKGIDPKFLFDSYRDKVTDFHQWLRDQVQQAAEPNLSEYRKYEWLLNSFDWNSWWNVILKQFVMDRGLDPYQHLQDYLTEDELNRVLSLPMRAREQVDLIIELVDVKGFSDDELRETAHRPFCVTSSPDP